jgi:two-component system chemotaxis sensor kinase CheA
MSGDNTFFEELQMDFLNESAFMLEQYEEYMMKLENSENPTRDLTDIFRVAHSVKGGAAAVGLTDLSKFAHVMEDLLDLLRAQPELVNSDVISILLKSGDELKNRISGLQKGIAGEWDTKDLVSELIRITETLSGKASKHSLIQVPSEEEKINAPDDFFTSVQASAEVVRQIPADQEDVTNHELLAELLAQLSPEDQAEFHAKEAEEKKKGMPVNPEPPVALVASVVPRPSAPQSASEASLKLASTTPNQNGSGQNGPKKSNAKNAGSVIKVDTGRVDSVLDAVGELLF